MCRARAWQTWQYMSKKSTTKISACTLSRENRSLVDESPRYLRSASDCSAGRRVSAPAGVGGGDAHSPEGTRIAKNSREMTNAWRMVAVIPSEVEESRCVSGRQ